MNMEIIQQSYDKMQEIDAKMLKGLFILTFFKIWYYNIKWAGNNTWVQLAAGNILAIFVGAI